MISKTKVISEPKPATPAELLMAHKAIIEYAIQKVDREIEDAARIGKRVQARREELLIELVGIERAIEKLGGAPDPEADR